MFVNKCLPYTEVDHITVFPSVSYHSGVPLRRRRME